MSPPSATSHEIRLALPRVSCIWCRDDFMEEVATPAASLKSTSSTLSLSTATPSSPPPPKPPTNAADVPTKLSTSRASPPCLLVTRRTTPHSHCRSQWVPDAVRDLSVRSTAFAPNAMPSGSLCSALVVLWAPLGPISASVSTTPMDL